MSIIKVDYGTISGGGGKPDIIPFSEATDDQLIDMLNAYYNGIYNEADIRILKEWAFPIGAKRTLSLSAMSATGVSESHHADNYAFVIIGQEHDNLTAPINDKTKALLTIQQDRILYTSTTATTYSTNYPTAANEGGYMNSSDTNSGGWTSCARRTWCNNVYYGALSSTIQNLIKSVDKLTSAGSNSSTINTTSDKIFLLSEYEVAGTTTMSKAGEGSRYAYYDSSTKLLKMPKWSSYNGALWWLRSPSTNSTHFCDVHNNGGISGNGSSYCKASTPQGIAPAFCL